MTDKPIEPDNNPLAVASATSGLATPPIGWWTQVHWGLLVVALVPLAMAGRGQHFFYDEWAFLGEKRNVLPLPDRYLLPHSEHWSTLPLLAYRALDETVGLGSYWPYIGLLLLLHLSVTHVLWRLMLVTGSKPIVATALAAVFSVLGAAAEDLVWAFQIGFVGSTLLGAGASYLAVTGNASWRKTGLLAALIVAGLATSGVGVTYLIVVPLILAWRQRRYAFVALGVPLLLYGTWYALYGHPLTRPPNASAALPLVVGAFVALGLVAALTGYFGIEMNNGVGFLLVGVPILAGVTLACRGFTANRTLAGRAVTAMCVGAVAFLGTAGLAREGLGLGVATSPRYIYVVIALLAPAIALVISNGTDRHPRLTKAIVPVAIAIAASNIWQLNAYAADTRHSNDSSRRVLVAASNLARSTSPIFAEQLPEPLLAPDLTTMDLRSGHLDAAFESVMPDQSNRLTASLNLQVRVTPARSPGAASTCRGRNQRIAISTSGDTAPLFVVSADAIVAVTLHDAGWSSAQRELVLRKGIYVVNSLRDASDLTIESKSPSSLLQRC